MLISSVIEYISFSRKLVPVQFVNVLWRSFTHGLITGVDSVTTITVFVGTNTKQSV